MAKQYAEPESVRFGAPSCRNCGRYIEYDEDVKDWHHVATGKLSCE